MNWPLVRHYFFSSLVLNGLKLTIYLTLISMTIGAVGGVIVAIMVHSDNPLLRWVAKTYIAFFRGTPLLVQIIFWGYLGAIYPRLSINVPFTHIAIVSVSTNTVLSATVAAVAGLGFNEVAYAAEITRSGLEAVDRMQIEAAYSLGLTPAKTMRHVILPQAIRIIIPPMGNQLITMLKTTSLVSVIGTAELLTRVEEVYNQNFEVLPLLTVASLWYLVIVLMLTALQSRLERRLARGKRSERTSKRSTKARS